MLVIFSGLPGVGKTTLARELACRLAAVHLRIDAIEQAIRECAGPWQDLKDVGYRVAYAVAEENLRIGRIVIADSVNPIRQTRDAWLDVAKRAGVVALEVEIRCSDRPEHRRRIEARVADIPGMKLPDWPEVLAREYEEWGREHLVIETAGRTVRQNIEMICRELRRLRPGG